ncbi:MAG: hypothetical protein L6R38_005941 [Xanthoria sp. 2 TBL-2021]|nr:MAG: hypothetical protein L6R38_005941 [Xanthoria sp. 2 TBL-2021]
MAEPAPTTNEPTIEADPELTTDESDSTLGDDVSRYTASLTSSIQRYPVENNRRYHAYKDGCVVPPNVKFEVDDCEEPWTFREKFDLIHIRYLAAAIADWPKLISQAFQFTKPGGYSEFQDYDIVFYSEDGTLTDDLPIQKWITTFIQAARDFGREPCPGPRLAGLMRDAGFQNVQEKKYKVPIGPWPKDKHLKTIGAWNLVQMENGLEGFTLRLFTQTLGWKSEEVHVLLANVRKDLRNPRIHAQLDLYDFCRAPLQNELLIGR